MSARLALAASLACLASLLACAADPDDGNADAECVAGRADCPCAANGACDPGLQCEGDLCVPSSETSGDGDPTGDGDPSTGDGDPGDGDPDTSCHPLMIDCSKIGTTCTWDGAQFSCTQGEIAIGDSCVPDSPVCISGFCAPMAMVPDCPSTHCCASFCNLDTPNCPIAGTACVDYFPDGATTPEVGACLAP